ncbi:catechol O-methyltransferase-like isoform X2 [Protopterus annectens]|nr:catechol O-methyltransferase-like isoform X2 [Protopterus annectens]XP_043924638.1 catechol O-methyltransferase-like isoform X2 [Protopterus annectens]
MAAYYVVLIASLGILLLAFALLKKIRYDMLVVLWHAFIVKSIINFFKGNTREQRLLDFALKTATRGDPQSVINAIDQYCSQTEWAMNIGDEKGLIMDKVVKECNPDMLLEMGTYCGYSALRTACIIKPTAQLLSLEIDPRVAEIAKQMIEFAGVQDKVKVIVGSTQDIIPQLKKKSEVDTFDYVFLDHWKDRYAPDTKLLEEHGLLRKGTVLLADNVICPGAPEFLQYVRNSPNYECTYYPAHIEYNKNIEDGLEKAVFKG